MKENKNIVTIDFQSRESAEHVEAIVKASQLSQLYTTSFTYSVSEADNRVVKGKNRISVLNEEQNRAERIIKTLKLDSSHDATSRIEVWVDKTQIVVYIGASFNVSAKLAEKHSDEAKELFKSFAELHASSRDMKWRYAQSCETRHKFNSFESFKSFYNQLSQLISIQLIYEAEQRAKAEEQKQKEAEAQKAEQKAEQKSTAKQKSSKRKSKEQKETKKEA